MIVVKKESKIENCKHRVGECYLEDDGVGDPMFIAHIFNDDKCYLEPYDFYAIINIRTGETICVDESLEFMDIHNKQHQHIETELVIKGASHAG